ncbi:MAG: radical SAM family heme chaperone HemW [Oligosphaeraceae bacterium]
MRRPLHSLYIHVPFCAGGKCDYCAFASQGHSTEEERRAYLQGLEREFLRRRQEFGPLESIFIGGGTPSSLSAEELSCLLALVRRHFERLPDCEWSCEANPDSLDGEKVEVLLAGGVNRLSLGVQSFHPVLRAALGRRGSLETLEEVVALARGKGLPRLNLDLIYAIPGETPAMWEEDLRKALSLHPDHLSCYSLTIEEGTPLARRLPRREHDPEEEERFLTFWNAADALLGAAGFSRYEISNFARQGCQCRHNQQVWHGQTYGGCGPAAVSFDGLCRWGNPPVLREWLRGTPPEKDLLSPEGRRREVLAFAMRTTEGWDAQGLRERAGLELSQVLAMPECQRLLQEGLLACTEGRLHPTPRGLLFNDLVLEALIL